MGSASVQGELWGRAAAAWAELMEPQLRPLADATLRALEQAGLECTLAGEVDCPFVFADLDQAWTGHRSSGALQKVIDAVGADAVRTTLVGVLEADRKPDGQLRQNNVFRFVGATKH